MTEHAKTVILLCLAVLILAGAAISWAVASHDPRSFPTDNHPTVTIEQGP